MTTSSFAKILLALLLSSFTTYTFATCYRITSINTNSGSVYYTEPGKGTAGAWGGSTDSSGTMGTTPRVININNNNFQPLGSLIATGYVSFLDSGSARYEPEQILFRCTADEDGFLKEFYATNGDSAYAGMYQANPALGLDQTYTTIVNGVGIRVKNVNTGEYFSRYWKSRPLTNLDRDSQGWILVKAKNFSDSSIELFKIDYGSGVPVPSVTTGTVSWTQPSTYTAFKCKQCSLNVTENADSAYYYNGWYLYWPGAINLHQNIVVRRAATCMVENVTPNVFFPLISKNEIDNNVKVTAPINIRFQCQSGSPANSGLSGFVSGTANTQTAMGFLPNPANITSAIQENLTVSSGSGVTHLLSNGYGMPNIATGVGVRLYQLNGTALNYLSSLSNTGQGAANGWYPVLTDAISVGVVNGVTTYSKTVNASLEKIPGKVVKPGKFDATVQVIIQVQ
ncbi:fimbrial protein [Providencia sp. PROV188]|jgi:hypothetical protein|uniref:Fimbrial protein n=2 Tax=Providencia TaxID=586 RepID=A0A4R3NDC0_9GAMM|nr:fimbrial protein [Providencia alcalifaciens]MBC5788844.1 fimbrial protein [Providencia sp. JUb39]MTB46831.1 fimbrial protein [Providencia sp. wls1950]MTC22830.1 fimbrial protein [Providencia sp. wls1938]MTC41611.1 fimbrial protein [Providencia sp. wls1921]MTC78170.1 fimbrial protein [Providencia sp. wls1916]WBM60894.1 fimbrial protein [Providencia sp. PROV188]